MILLMTVDRTVRLFCDRPLIKGAQLDSLPIDTILVSKSISRH